VHASPFVVYFFSRPLKDAMPEKQAFLVGTGYRLITFFRFMEWIKLQFKWMILWHPALITLRRNANFSVAQYGFISFSSKTIYDAI
jgi:hypothetical protein